MLRRVTMAAVVAVVAAAMAAPAALAQDDYSTTQVEYGQDVYGGTEGGTEEEAATGSAGQSGGAWTKFTAKLSGDNEVGGGDPDGSGTAAVKTRGTEVCYDLKWTGVDVTMATLADQAAAGTLSVKVQATAPLADALPLIADLYARKVTGKVVLTR